MRIAQIASLQVAVPPRTYGGTERVVHALTEGLVRLGHDVTLFATGDSRTSARLVPLIARAVNFDPAIDITAVHVAALAEVYRQADHFDIIHSHLENLTPPFAAAARTPTVLTLHGRLDDLRSTAGCRNTTNCHYVAISQSQRSALPDLDWAATIHHGIDVDAFPYYPEPGPYLAFVGRISPDKRPDRAIEIAVCAGVPLKIAAKADPTDADYFHTVIEPLLDHPLIEFQGELDEAGKRDLMGHALALLLPIDWPEPFGMVFIESRACGTPVLTCPVGSVPELLRDGVTGYACNTLDGCVAAVKALPAISCAGCRAYVKARFDVRQMALAYINVYAQAQGRRRPFVDAVHAEDAAEPTWDVRPAGDALRCRLLEGAVRRATHPLPPAESRRDAVDGHGCRPGRRRGAADRSCDRAVPLPDPKCCVGAASTWVGAMCVPKTPSPRRQGGRQVAAAAEREAW